MGRKGRDVNSWASCQLVEAIRQMHGAGYEHRAQARAVRAEQVRVDAVANREDALLRHGEPLMRSMAAKVRS